MGNPNWGKLVHEGRAKAMGVPWNEKELHAIYTLKIPVEYVRRGALTEKQVEKLKEADATPVESLSKEELIERARGNEARITGDDKKADTKKADTKKADDKKK